MPRSSKTSASRFFLFFFHDGCFGNDKVTLYRPRRRFAWFFGRASGS